MAMSRPPKPLIESKSPIRSKYPGHQYRYVVAKPRLRRQHGFLDLPRHVVGPAGRRRLEDLGELLRQQYPLRRARLQDAVRVEHQGIARCEIRLDVVKHDLLERADQGPGPAEQLGAAAAAQDEGRRMAAVREHEAHPGATRQVE